MSVQFVVLAYKQSPYIEECLKSLVNQDIEHHSILIATSTPSPFIERLAYSMGIPLRINPHRASISADWNFALENADSEYLTLCHQDDLYAPSYARRLSAAMKTHDNALIGFSDHMEHTPQGSREVKLNLRIKRMLLKLAFGKAVQQEGTAVRRRLLAWGNPICCPSVMFNRSLLKDFRFSDEFQINLDWDAWDRITSLPGKLVYVPEMLVSHRVHPDSETSAGIADKRRYDEDLAMFSRYWPSTIARLILDAYKLSYKGNQV